MSYSVVKDAVLASGIYKQIINEAVGTGDGTNKAFTLEEQKVVEDSEKIYVAGALQTEGTHYTINYERAQITFANAPANAAAVTADYKHIGPELITEDIQNMIDDADAEINEWTGKKFTSTNVTEWFPGRSNRITSSGSVSSGQYYEVTEEDKYLIILSNYPIISITSLQFMDDDGVTVDDTLVENTDFHLWPDIGKIWIITNTIPAGHNKRKVKVVYTHGYATVPRIVKRLSATIAAIDSLITATGGTYDDVTSYTLGPKSVAVGEPYMNLKAAIERLEKKRDMLWNMVGREFRAAVV